MGKQTMWKQDNYKFVGHEFNHAYANKLDSANLLKIVGEKLIKSIDYELSSGGGYGELQRYDGQNLTFGTDLRGFKTILYPEEYTLADMITRKQCNIDRSGNCKRVGSKLGKSAAMSVYLKVLRMFGNAWDGSIVYGDGKPWASKAHPVASMADEGRGRVADKAKGTFSNVAALTLTTDNIDVLRGRARRFVTPDGLPMLNNFNLLLVSPELEATAKKLLGDGSGYKPAKDPETGNNAASSISDMKYLVVGGGTDGFSAKQWAICDPELMLDSTLIVYNNKPEVLQQEQDNPLNDVYVAYVDFAVGAADPRAIIFSDPDKTALV